MPISPADIHAERDEDRSNLSPKQRERATLEGIHDTLECIRIHMVGHDHILASIREAIAKS